MTYRILSAAWLVASISLTAPSYAAEEDFKTWVVTESRTYVRLQTFFPPSPSIGLPVSTGRVSVHSVTLALEGARITGEWESLRSEAEAEDFPVGTNVQAAIRVNEVRLKHPDGSVVEARIVRRVKPEETEDEDERD